jgi:very-short-patch-repair endonuclease
MTYSNQRDHTILDRRIIRQLLLDYGESKIVASPSEDPRAEHLKKLMNQAGSNLEKEWLNFLEMQDLRLPSKAQHFMEACKTRPDFFYEDHLSVIYVDGPVHDYPDRAKRDVEQTDCLEDLGYTVIRFGHRDDWGKIITKFHHVFGAKRNS